jgi:hypothetical protein
MSDTMKRIRAMANEIVKLATRHENALVGPVVWYPANDSNASVYAFEPDDRVWSISVSIQRGSGHSSMGITLGLCGPEIDPVLAAASDFIVVVRRDADATYDDAMGMRAMLINFLAEQFEKVHVAETELQAAKILVALWPSERSKNLLRNVKAEQAA